MLKLQHSKDLVCKSEWSVSLEKKKLNLQEAVSAVPSKFLIKKENNTFSHVPFLVFLVTFFFWYCKVWYQKWCMNHIWFREIHTNKMPVDILYFNGHKSYSGHCTSHTPLYSPSVEEEVGFAGLSSQKWLSSVHSPETAWDFCIYVLYLWMGLHDTKGLTSRQYPPVHGQEKSIRCFLCMRAEFEPGDLPTWKR